MFKAVFISGFVFLLSFFAKGQKLQLTVYSTGNGEIQNGARQIFQDNKGWLWFIGGRTIIRYDGHRFLSILPAAGEKMDYCSNLFQMGNETWVISSPYPLIVDGDSLRKHPLNIRDDIVSPVLYKGKQYYSCEDGLYSFANDTMTRLIKHSVRGDNRNKVFQYNDSLLVGNFFRTGMFVFNMNRLTSHYMPGRTGKIQQDKNGNTYIHLLDEGIVQITGIQLRDSTCSIEKKLLHPLTAKEASYFIFDDNGVIWAFSSFNWLKKISPGKTEKLYTEASGFPGFVFMDIFKDRENNIWLAHPDGISKITDQGIRRYAASEGLAGNHISDFFKTPSGKYLLAASKEGTSVFNGIEWKPVSNGNGPFYIYKTVFHRDKQFIVADNVFSEVQIDFHSAKLRYQRPLIRFTTDVLEMASDTSGSIYFTTQKGVYHYYKNRLLVFDSAKLGRSLLVDSRNRLWIGGWFNGLDGYRIQYVNTVPHYQRIHFAISNKKLLEKINSIRAIKDDGNGNILVGTISNGLFHLTLRNDTVVNAEQISEKENLLDKSVRRIDVDAGGRWWVVNDRGVNSVTGSSGRRVVKDEGSSFNIIRVSALLCNGNMVWMGNYPGAVSLDQKREMPDYPFNIYITKVNINNKPATISLTGRTKLRYRENSVSISYSANSFRNEKTVRYVYQLQNNGDTSWSEPLAEHQVNFSALKPGNYIFRVKAVDHDSRWSNNTAEYHFSIMKPFWLRWWFITGILLLVAGTLYSIYRLRIRQLKHLHSMRNEISRNLHDDIGSSLTNIHILNELAQRNMNDKEKVESYIAKSGETIQRINESLSEIVWNINPKYDNISHLLARMKWYAAEMMDGKNINADIFFPENGEDLAMPMDQRRDFYLIFKELVNNLARHSAATEATISVVIKDNIIELLLKDNGKGFDATNVKRGNGLESMKQRAEKWNASIKVKSVAGKGTTSELVMKF